MRKTTLFIRFSLLAGFLAFYACKKNADETKAEETKAEEIKTEQKSNAELAGKVTEWLKKQRLLYTDDRGQKIDSLKKALLLSDITVESYKDNQQLIVVPVGIGFKSANNAGKSLSSYLVMVLNTGAITKGNLIQYLPAARQGQVPRNTFSKIFTYQRLEIDGRFSVLGITDEFVYELTFINGRLKSVADRRTKSSEEANGKTNSCIDWYLVTTYYDVYGDVVDVVEEFLFETCGDGDACRTRRIENRNFRTFCQGGTGGTYIDYSYDASRTRRWDVYTTPNGKNKVWSEEVLNGTKAGDSSTFSSIRHSWADVTNTVGENDQEYAHYSSDNSWTSLLSADKKKELRL